MSWVLLHQVTLKNVYFIYLAMGSKFKKFSSQVWPLVAKGIEAVTQQELFVASLGALVELSRSCPDETANYLGDLINHLIGLLNVK
jgi:hypothetical protein